MKLDGGDNQSAAATLSDPLHPPLSGSSASCPAELSHLSGGEAVSV